MLHLFLDEEEISTVVKKEKEKVETNPDVEMPQDEKTTDNQVDHCRKFIESIRHDEFGVGMEIGEKEQKLLDIHREREGRSLNRLSRELYTKDSHFVLELVQNADDNEYPDVMMKKEDANGEKPAVAFVLQEDRVIILNNEKGFHENNIRALCDIGKSTKGLHRKGYIGKNRFIVLNIFSLYFTHFNLNVNTFTFSSLLGSHQIYLIK